MSTKNSFYPRFHEFWTLHSFISHLTSANSCLVYSLYAWNLWSSCFAKYQGQAWAITSGLQKLNKCNTNVMAVSLLGVYPKQCSLPTLCSTTVRHQLRNLFGVFWTHAGTTMLTQKLSCIWFANIHVCTVLFRARYYHRYLQQFYKYWSSRTSSETSKLKTSLCYLKPYLGFKKIC